MADANYARFESPIGSEASASWYYPEKYEDLPPSARLVYKKARFHSICIHVW
jgi:hypothetical protein